MSTIGKFHEISFYGLVTSIICIITNKLSIQDILSSAFTVNSFTKFFTCYLFWSSVLFIPIAIVGGFSTKYGDYGEGLSFDSENIFVIMFAHVGEEILGIVLTPFWFLKDVFTGGLDGIGKIVDYITYVLEIVFIVIGYLSL